MHVNDVTETDAGRHAHLPLPHMDAGTISAELEACCAYLERSARPPAADAPPSQSGLKRKQPDAAAPELAGAATPAAASARTTPRRGDRIQVYWTDEARWFAGVAGSTRRSDGATRIAYDAVDAWPAIAEYHDMRTTEWRLL